MNLLDSIASGFNKIKDSVEDVFDIMNPKSDEDPAYAKRAFEAAEQQASGSETGNMIKHYLKNSGEEYDYPVDSLRKNRIVSNGENENQIRLLESITTTNKLRKRKAYSPYDDNQYRLKDIKDGEIFKLDDYYDYDVSTTSVTRNPFLSLDADLATSLGSFKLKTKSNLEFKKYGNELFPSGDIEHSVQDTYNFSKSGLLGETGSLLQESGQAKPFPVKASWKKRPYGIIKIDDNDFVDTSHIKWE